MSRQRIYWNTSRKLERVHQQKLIRKVERIQVLKAVLETWEADPNADHDYILGLRARLRSAENQLAAMRP